MSFQFNGDDALLYVQLMHRNAASSSAFERLKTAELWWKWWRSMWCKQMDGCQQTKAESWLLSGRYYEKPRCVVWFRVHILKTYSSHLQIFHWDLSFSGFFVYSHIVSHRMPLSWLLIVIFEVSTTAAPCSQRQIRRWIFLQDIWMQCSNYSWNTALKVQKYYEV